MLILAETTDSPTATDRSIAAELAQIMGLRVYPVPHISEQFTSERALQQVPVQSEKTAAIWLSKCPTPEQYRSFYQAALQQRIALLNSPEQHEAVQCFDRLATCLSDLLPDCQMMTEPGQCQAAIDRLGLPVLVRSSTEQQVAPTWEDLQQQLQTIWQNCPQSPIWLQQQPELNRSPSQPDLGREFRVFFYRQLLTYAYRWDVDDPLKWLSVEEEEELLTVATDAMQRLPDAFVAIDLGQQTSGEWRVLNVVDAQFAITRQVPLPHLWYELREWQKSGDIPPG